MMVIVSITSAIGAQAPGKNARSLRVLVTFALWGGIHVTAASAQPQRALPSGEVTAQMGYLPLYTYETGGNSIDTWALSVRVGYRLPLGTRRTVVEGYLVHAAQDRDPDNRAPRWTFIGALTRFSLRDPRKGADPFVAVGWGHMRVDAEEVECEPTNCIVEELHYPFRDARLATFVADLGLLYPVTRAFAVRGDIRLYVPYNVPADVGSTGDKRAELAGGVGFRF
jgi:hypothetical protein